MNKIFISYRREDSADTCGRIYEWLVNRFGKDSVFKDVDSIPLGVPFPDYITSVIQQCAVQLVVIGPHFASITGLGGRPRLHDPEDFVRIEVESGLERTLRHETVVVPVLVQGASMPGRHKLPGSLRLLVSINGASIRRDPDFASDMRRLIAQIERWLGVAAPEEPIAPAPSPVSDPPAAQMRRLIADAHAAYDAGHLSDAVLKAKLALTLPGGEFDIALWRLLAVAHHRLNALADALTALDRAQALTPLDDTATRLAIFAERRAIQAEQQQWPDALATLQDELRLAPDDPIRLEALADLQGKIGHPADALDTLRRLTAHPDAPATAWLARARLALAARLATEARTALDTAAHLAPSDPILATLRAQLDDLLDDLLQPIPRERFPKRLTDLGFIPRKERDVEYILPPLCSVPAGSFLMGSDKSRDLNGGSGEQPQHTVTLSSYQIARFPITVAEYACFVRAGHAQPRDWHTQLGELDHPVIRISWHDAVAYAAWLAQITGQPWRLPTEAEWEKAARGTDGRLYPWGNTFDASRCNTNESSKRTTTSVGSYSTGTSPCGAQDVAGNVWEWTSSIFKPYPYNQSDGREVANSIERRVLRGGSWADDARLARAAFRLHNRPDEANFNNGIRLALDLERVGS